MLYVCKPIYFSFSNNLDDGVHGHLLGDSGYAQRVYLMTPYLHPEGVHQEGYNLPHSVTRVWVEHLFGMWKWKFACLNGMQLQPQRWFFLSTIFMLYFTIVRHMFSRMRVVCVWEWIFYYFNKNIKFHIWTFNSSH